MERPSSSTPSIGFVRLCARLLLVALSLWLWLLATPAVHAAPSISSISPKSGPQSGWTKITISGANFVSGATVTIGGQPASGVTFVSSTQLTALTPPSPVSGAVAVTVTNPDGTSATLSGSTQLLSNPGFELGAQYWKSNGSGTASVQNNSIRAHSGSFYADLISPSGTHPVLFAASSTGVPIYFPVSPGNVITFGGWASRVSGNGLARFAIEVTDSAKSHPSWVQTTPSNVTGSTWVQMSATYTVPTGKAFIRFYPELFGTTVTSEVRFDDATLVLNGSGSGGFTYAPPPSVSSVSPNSGPTAGGTVVTITGAHYVSGATVKFGGIAATGVTFVSSTQLRATTPAGSAAGSVAVVVTNPDGQSGAFGTPTVLVINPGFESGIVNWALLGGGTATVKTSSTVAHSGNNYLEVTSAVGNHPQVYNADSSNHGIYFPVQPGDLITFGGWANRVSGDGSARWNLVSYDGNKANPNYPHPFPSNVTSGKWAEQFGSYIVPAGRAFVGFYTEIYANTVSADARFDDGFLTRQTGGFNYTTSTATVTSLSVTPSNPTIGAGATQQFTATANYSDGTTQDVTTLATWASSNTAVATISNSSGSQGRATGLTAGSTTISASYQSFGGNTTLNVTAASLTGFFTYQGNNKRVGQVTNEATLTGANVNSTTFGKKYSFGLDGWAFGQPLYISNLIIAGKPHNVVYVATMHDSVYAFDADNQQSTPLWQRNFLNSANGVTTIPMSDVGHANLYPEIGIVSTPVIDPGSQTIYVVAATKEPGPTYFWRLHALSLIDGSERQGSPVVLSAPGFAAQMQMNRAALLLSNGIVYVSFASYQDVTPYNGWLFAFNAQSLQPAAAPLNTTPTGSAGGIWNGGSGPAVDDSGNLYVATGNGTFDLNNAGSNMGDSMVKIGLVNGALARLDYFTPFDQSTLNTNDSDFGSGGVLLLPSPYPHVAIVGSKDDNVYVINADNMGGVHTSDNSQAIQVLAAGDVRSAPAFLNGTVYIGFNGAPMRAYTVNSSGQLTGPTSSTAHSMGYPGVSPIVSANGTSEGIVWVLERIDTSNNVELRAYDADNLSNELYDSQQNATRDAIGPGTRFATPLVYAGKVFVPTQKALVVFGLQ